MSTKTKRTCVLVGLLAAGLAAGAVGWAFFVHARVSGATPQDQIESVCRLADDRSPGAGRALADVAAAGADAPVRAAALVQLAQFPDPQHRDLVERCTGDADAQVRRAAAATLGVYGDRAAADRLGAMAMSDADAAARTGAVVGLGRCGHSNAVVWLLEATERSADPQVQYQAMRELYLKVGMRYIGPRPGRVDDWKRQAAFIVEYLKGFPKVQAAFAAADRELHRHPEHRSVTQCERDGQDRHASRAGGGAFPLTGGAVHP